MRAFFTKIDAPLLLTGGGLFAIGTAQLCLHKSSETSWLGITSLLIGLGLAIGDVSLAVASRFRRGQVLKPPDAGREMQSFVLALLLISFYALMDLSAYSAALAPRLTGFNQRTCTGQVTSKDFNLFSETYLLTAEVQCQDGASRVVSAETNRVYYQKARQGDTVEVSISAFPLARPVVSRAEPRLCERLGFTMLLGVLFVLFWFTVREGVRRLLLRSSAA